MKFHLDLVKRATTRLANKHEYRNINSILHSVVFLTVRKILQGKIAFTLALDIQ